MILRSISLRTTALAALLLALTMSLSANWGLHDELHTSIDAGDAFGWAVALEGDLGVVAAVRDDSAGNDAGAAYVVDFSGTYGNLSPLAVNDLIAEDNFGTSIAIEGSTILIGAAEAVGKAHVFNPDATGWSRTQVLTPADNRGLADLQFGVSVDVKGSTALVGGPGRIPEFTGLSLDQLLTLGDQLDAGAVYVFDYDAVGGTWAESAMLPAPNKSLYGVSVLLNDSADTAFVGAVADGLTFLGSIGNPTNANGGVHVYTRSGSNWISSQLLKALDGASGHLFGAAMALAGDQLLIGAPGAGKVYIFEQISGTWAQQSSFGPGTSQVGFGASLSVDGDLLLIGSPSESAFSSAYLYQRSGSGWTQVDTFTSGQQNDQFGLSVAITANRALIGAPGTDQFAQDGGKAYVFQLDSQEGMELVRNGGFETNQGGVERLPEDWDASAFFAARRVCNRDVGTPQEKLFSYRGDCALRFKRITAGPRMLKQELDMSGVQVGDTLRFRLQAQPRNSQPVRIGQFVVIYETPGPDGRPIRERRPITLDAVTGDYIAYTADDLIVEYPIRKARVKLLYNSTTGRLHIDEVSVRHIPAAAVPLPLPQGVTQPIDPAFSR